MKNVIKKILTQLGLNNIEQEIYLITLEYGPAPASLLAKQANLNRVTVYEILKRLSRQGYVKIRAKKGVKIKNFLAEDLSVIKEKLNKKLSDVEMSIQEIKEIEPQFRSTFLKKPEKPEIYFYEGKEGIKNVLMDTIEQKPNESIAFSSADFLEIGFDKKFLDNYWKKRVSLRIPARGIMPNTKKAQSWFTSEKNISELRQIKFITKENYSFENEIEIYGNNVGIISMEENNEYGIIIRSEKIAKNFKSLFELIWESDI